MSKVFKVFKKIIKAPLKLVASAASPAAAPAPPSKPLTAGKDPAREAKVEVADKPAKASVEQSSTSQRKTAILSRRGRSGLVTNRGRGGAATRGGISVPR